MSEHTPGPWEYHAATEYRFHVHRGKDVVATLHPDRQRANEAPSTESDLIADARLIAAAPDLLRAVKALLDGKPSALALDVANARAAIAKAEGR